MSYTTGTAANMTAVLNALNAFLTVGHGTDPNFTGTGRGFFTNLLGTGTTVAESITLTFTSATAFTVAGTVSGALGSGTVGTAFASAKIGFTLTTSAPAFVAGDTVSFEVSPPWTALRFNSGVSVDNTVANCLYQAPGDDGLSQIYVGFFRFTDIAGDYDNLRLGGFTGFDPAQKFTTQPGYIGQGPVLPGLRTGSMPYWFIADGRRVIIVLKCSTVYECAYLGFLDSYMNPGSFPYPLVVGGSLAFRTEPPANSQNWRWSYEGAEHSAFARSGGDSNFDTVAQARVRLIDGTWRGFAGLGTARQFSSSHITPHSDYGTDLRAGLDGSYPVFPFVLYDPANSYGEFNGVGWVSGHANMAENIVTDGADRWLVLQNINRNTKADFFAVRLV